MNISSSTRILFIDNKTVPVCHKYVSELLKYFSNGINTWYINVDTIDDTPAWSEFLSDKILIGNEFYGTIPFNHWRNVFVINTEIYEPVMKQFDYIFFAGESIVRIWEALLTESCFDYQQFAKIVKNNPQGIVINMSYINDIEPHEKIITPRTENGEESFIEMFMLDDSIERLDESLEEETSNSASS